VLNNKDKVFLKEGNIFLEVFKNSYIDSF